MVENLPFETGLLLFMVETRLRRISICMMFYVLQWIYTYSLAQKQWIKFSIEKSLVFFSVNLFKNLHAITYTILLYIYKVKKSRRMATLTYRHFGNPGRRRPKAHYNIVHKKAWLELFSDLLTSFNVQNHSHALQCVSSRPDAAAAGSRGLAAAIFLTIYISKLEYHRELACKISRRLTEKKPKLFSIENLIHCFCARLYTSWLLRLLYRYSNLSWLARSSHQYNCPYGQDPPSRHGAGKDSCHCSDALSRSLST